MTQSFPCASHTTAMHKSYLTWLRLRRPVITGYTSDITLSPATPGDNKANQKPGDTANESNPITGELTSELIIMIRNSHPCDQYVYLYCLFYILYLLYIMLLYLASDNVYEYFTHIN